MLWVWVSIVCVWCQVTLLIPHTHTLFVFDVLQNMSTGGNVARNVRSRNTGNMCTHSSVSLYSACRAVYTECSGDVFEIKWEFIRHNWLENGSKLPGPCASHCSSIYNLFSSNSLLLLLLLSTPGLLSYRLTIGRTLPKWQCSNVYYIHAVYAVYCVWCMYPRGVRV